MDRETIGVLRAQAWERAKGELKGMLHTFFGETEKFEELNYLMSKFEKDIEDNGLHE
jgi:hypothetical protein